ncbi:hypothetical protein Q0N71_23255 [Bacillus thuringiensis]|uniref:hypothetical protein n=1 Tax=Bacillus thuringiensis TaxID=1428 RepID=UPI00345847CF
MARYAYFYNLLTHILKISETFQHYRYLLFKKFDSIFSFREDIQNIIKFSHQNFNISNTVIQTFSIVDTVDEILDTLTMLTFAAIYAVVCPEFKLIFIFPNGNIGNIILKTAPLEESELIEIVKIPLNGIESQKIVVTVGLIILKFSQNVSTTNSVGKRHDKYDKFPH